MATKKQQPKEEQPDPFLAKPRAEVKSKLVERIELGKSFLTKPVANRGDLQEQQRLFRIWRDYNEALLRSLFSNDKISTEYVRRSTVSFFMAGGPPDLRTDIVDFHRDVNRHTVALESILERLDLFQEIPSLDKEEPKQIGGSSTSAPTDAVFVVHGHDELARSQVASMLKDIGLRPIILGEQPNKGQTVIEKLEFYGKQASFAVVLLTPDDIGRSKDANTERSRARQNVVLELGYFIGRLGRQNTCALYKKEIELPDMELPSDFTGVVYMPMDDSGGWKLLLAKELKAAGFAVDMNQL